MRWQTRISVAVVAVLIASIATTSRAAWPGNGAPISVFPCVEAATATVSDDHGGMYVVWTDDRTCNFNSVYVQHVTGSGAVAAGWPEFGTPVSTLTSGQGSAAATGDGNGGVIVVWADGRLGGSRLFAQRFAPEGTVLWTPGGIPVCNAPGDPVAHTILADGGSGVFIAWKDSRRGLTDDTPHHHKLFDLYTQHIDASGQRTWPTTGDSVSTNALVSYAISLVTDGGAGVLVAWVDM